MRSQHTRNIAQRRGLPPRAQAGFTLMEILATVAILVVVAALAAPNVIQLQRNMEVSENNRIAQDLYNEATFRVESLCAAGSTDAFTTANGLKAMGRPSDATRGDTYFYLEKGSVIAGVLDLNESNTRPGNYVIELQKVGGDYYSVYSAYYWTDSSLSYANVSSLRTQDQRTDKRIGYYHGESVNDAGSGSADSGEDYGSVNIALSAPQDPNKSVVTLSGSDLSNPDVYNSNNFELTVTLTQGDLKSVRVYRTNDTDWNLGPTVNEVQIPLTADFKNGPLSYGVPTRVDARLAVNGARRSYVGHTFTPAYNPDSRFASVKMDENGAYTEITLDDPNDIPTLEDVMRNYPIAKGAVITFQDMENVTTYPIRLVSNEGGYTIKGGTINGLTVNMQGEWAGLFESVPMGVTVDRFTVKDASVASERNGAGIIAGYSEGTITNCSASGSVSAGIGGYVGGLVGQVAGGMVSNCTVSADVSGAYNAGGLVGVVTGGTVTGSHVTGGSLSDVGNTAGGFVGFLETGTISSCDTVMNVNVPNCDIVGGFAGNIDSSEAASGMAEVQSCTVGSSGSAVLVSGKQGVGGFVGRATRANNIYQCNTWANVSADDFLGGFAGYLGEIVESDGGKYVAGGTGVNVSSCMVASEGAAVNVTPAEKAVYYGAFAGYVGSGSVTGCNAYTNLDNATKFEGGHAEGATTIVPNATSGSTAG